MDDLFGKTETLPRRSTTPAVDIPDSKIRGRGTFGKASGGAVPQEIDKVKNKRPKLPPPNRLTEHLSPIDINSGNKLIGQASQQANGPGLLNISNSHNSSKLNSSVSGSNQTKTTLDISGQELSSTNISPISANGGVSRPLVRSVSGDQNSSGANTTNSSQLRKSLNFTTSSRARNSQRDQTSIANSVPKKVTNNVSHLTLLTGEPGVKEMLQSLGLLCLVSVLLSIGSLVFLMKVIPTTPELLQLLSQENNYLSKFESKTVYQVTVTLCSLTLTLNLSCLMVCAIQFIFATKLVKTSHGSLRTSKYLKQASISRICAIGGFFLSIPLFLIGIVLFSFLHFHETSAILTSVVIGFGIVFCGAAVVHNVFVWQREKTSSQSSIGTVLDKTLLGMENKKGDTSQQSRPGTSHSRIVLPHATLDLSNGTLNGTITAKSLDLSTLV